MTQSLLDVTNLQLPGSSAACQVLQAQPPRKRAKSGPFIFTKENHFLVRNVKFREGLVVNCDNVKIVSNKRILAAPYGSFGDSQCSAPLKELMAMVGNNDPSLLTVDVTPPIKPRASKSSPEVSFLRTQAVSV
jgi:hypothetical protein